jgi:hypothetical protein
MIRKKNLALFLSAIICSAITVGAQDNAELLERIKALEKRLEEKDAAAKATTTTKPEVAVPEEKPENKIMEFFGKTHFSGFASGSYIYNFNRGDKVTGRSFDVNHDEFMLNKLKLVMERPVDFSPDKWDAGYRADLIFGQDAQLIQSAGLNLGTHGDLEQLYGTINVPVGKGLQVSYGKMVTLMGVEVIEETANPNWSEGNQFLFVENFAGLGVQLAYKWTDKIDTQFRIINGWDVVKDNNNAKSYMARIGFAPDAKTSIGLVGYGGPEQSGNSGAWREGVNLVLSRKLSDKLTAWGQLDYGHEDANSALPRSGDAKWYAGGLWLSYDFCEKMGVAVRADYLKDEDGARTSGSPFTAPFPVNRGQDLSSLTLTLNWKPIKDLQVRPEIRWDHSSGDLFRGHRSGQFTAGVGVAYLF